MGNNVNDCVLRYTTIDNTKAQFCDGMFDARIVEHTYENGAGKLYFDHPITECGFYQNTWEHWNNKIKSIIIPNSVISLRCKAMYRLKHIETITIPENIVLIGDEVFKACSSLKYITIPDSVTRIGSNAFSGCRSLTDMIIPNSVTSIGNSAFEGCRSLVSVTIGNSVTSIGDAAFEGCTSLMSITIPDSVVEIGNNVFYGCTAMQKFYGKFASDNNDCLIVDGTLHSYAHVGPSTFVFPNIVTAIGDNAFKGCSLLMDIIIPDSVTSIGNKAFYGCTSLISITIPNSVKMIGDHAFSRCSELNSVVIPDSVISIGDFAFEYCSNLEDIVIGNCVKEIGEEAFYFCRNIKSVNIPDSVIRIGAGTLRHLDLVVLGRNVQNISDAFMKSHGGQTIIFTLFNIENIGRYCEDTFRDARLYIPSNSIDSAALDKQHAEHYLMRLMQMCRMIYKYEPSELHSIIEMELEWKRRCLSSIKQM